MKKRKWWMVAVLLLVLVIPVAIWWVVQLQKPLVLTETHYEIPTEKLDQPWKLAMLSDLHNASYGEDNRELVEAVRNFGPDAILMCGDMVSRWNEDVSVALELCEDLVELAPVYYLYGNHEGVLQYSDRGPQVPLDTYLNNRGVTVLYGGIYEIPHGEDAIWLYAKSVTAKDFRESISQQAQFREFQELDGFQLAVSHFPDLFYDALADEPFDLALAGHYHGGQMILPGVGGLFHRDTGLFPDYYGGAYPLTHGTLIVSRGLGNDVPVPRINNDPELVLIEVVPAGDSQ